MVVIAGELIQNEFAKNHIKYVEFEAKKLFKKIKQLRNKYWISKEELKRTKIAFKSILGLNKEQVLEYKDEIAIGFKVFLFIQAFNTEELTFLYDLGQPLRIQVYDGDAQYYAREFFTFYYNKFLKYCDTNFIMNEKFDYYTFEQIIRILNDYEQIVKFVLSETMFSKGYIYNKEKYGELLAVSVTGESNKIFVWDISSGQYEPIAALGGLYESVSKVRIVRSDSQVMVAAKGNRQIYLWNLISSDGMPVFIFRSPNPVYRYAVVRSMNGELHIIGASREDIYIWAINEDEKPIKIYNKIKESEDIIVIDTKLGNDYPTYTMIGDEAQDSFGNCNIFELKEVSPLNYSLLKLIDKEGVLGSNYINKIDNYSMDCCQITSESKIFGALFREALFLYDFNNKRNLLVIPKNGQQVLGFKMVEVESVIYVLTYHIYSKRLDNGEGLVKCYVIRDGKLINQKEWFSGKDDMKKAVLVKNGNSFYIFFNQYNSNKIYRSNYESDNYEEFYKLPNSMYIVDMISE